MSIISFVGYVTTKEHGYALALSYGTVRARESLTE